MPSAKSGLMKVRTTKAARILTIPQNSNEGDLASVRRMVNNLQKHPNGASTLLFDVATACRWEESEAVSHAAMIDLRGYSLQDLPYYEKALASAKQNYEKVIADSYPQDFKLPRGKGEHARREHFLSCLSLNGISLTQDESVKLISDAARACDEEFFVRVAKTIEARWKRSEPTSPKIKLTFHWAPCLMWLMTDAVGFVYLRDHVYNVAPESFPVTEAAYTKTKQRLKLFQHPKPPITGITVDGRLLGLDKLVSELSR